MFYIVGLGNPGEKYKNNRHNVGWMALDYVIETLGMPKPMASSKYGGHISEGAIEKTEVIFLYPDTFMNNSGSAVKKLVPKGEESNLIVVYDDIDIPVGEIKVSIGRGDGGHNGVKSIIKSLDTKDFVRVRVGIAPKNIFGQTKRPTGARLPKHVLGDFKKGEEKKLTETFETVTRALNCIVSEGIEKAMNTYN